MKLRACTKSDLHFTGDKLIRRLAVLALGSFCLIQLPTRIIPTSITVASSCECLVFFLGGVPSIGFVPGEILRITVSDPNFEELTELRTEPTRAQVKLFDAQGNQIAQSPEFSIPLSGFHTVEFRREAIPQSGDPDTGRLQVHPTVILQRLANPQLPSNATPVRTGGANSLELVDSEGSTKIWIDLGFPARIRS